MTYQDKVILGDCREVMKTIPDKSVDAIVTDPPYELGFMGKKWDASGIAYSPEVWNEAFRVLKPGGHLLSFGGDRTYHRMACAIEDAGFEIRDQIQWLYGSGFPKSYNINKGIDKQAGAEREVIGKRVGTYADIRRDKTTGIAELHGGIAKEKPRIESFITTPATPEAQQWDGWGTALKPANEPICLARKPLSEKTIVENVLKWGTGGINIDGCRIATNESTLRPDGKAKHGNNAHSPSLGTNWNGAGFSGGNLSGRFPANLILDEEAGRMLDEQSGESKSAGGSSGHDGAYSGGYKREYYGDMKPGFGDKGGASRFFYCAKSSRSERNAGLEGMEEVEYKTHGATNPDNTGNSHNTTGQRPAKAQNHHPTVKPISLMRYLCRLITPPNGTVLDPFTGSGTTGCACAMEGFGFIGIEQNKEYMEIAKRRIQYWQDQKQEDKQMSLL